MTKCTASLLWFVPLMAALLAAIAWDVPHARVALFTVVALLTAHALVRAWRARRWWDVSYALLNLAFVSTLVWRPGPWIEIPVLIAFAVVAFGGLSRSVRNAAAKSEAQGKS